MKIGFDNEKYLELQAQHIRQRRALFGGKLFDDYHASRVLPGFQPDSKVRMLATMKDETVALLERKCPIDHIKVKIDIQPEYITSAEAKATYSMIKEYILEKNGVKVSNLYIAQVKDEFGIKERENYNIAKNGSPAKDLHVTNEKRELIIEALKHFKMIE